MRELFRMTHCLKCLNFKFLNFDYWLFSPKYSMLSKQSSTFELSYFHEPQRRNTIVPLDHFSETIKEKVISTLFCDIVNITHKPLLSGSSVWMHWGNSLFRVMLSTVPSAASHAYRSDTGEGIYSSVIRAALLAKCFL